MTVFKAWASRAGQIGKAAYPPTRPVVGAAVDVGLGADSAVPDAEAQRCQRRREIASAGRSKNASRLRRRAALFRSVTSKLSFPVRSMNLLSRPDRHPPSHGAQRRGWEEQSHAQYREHGEHRTFPAVSTVASLLPRVYIRRW